VITAPPRVETPTGPARSRSASRRRRRVLGLLGCLVGLAIVTVLSVSIGSREVSLDEIVRAFTDPTATGLAEEAVRARIPRTVLGLLVGAALGLSGAIMQGVTRNPLADPGILGVNTGASLFVVTGIAFFGMTTVTQYIWLALAGAGAAAVFVYTVGSLGRGGATPLKLALAGAATTAALGSLISAIVLPRVDALQVFRFWQIGGVGGANWESMGTVLPFLVVGAALSLLSARSLDALALGDELATGLGGRIVAARAIAALGGVLLWPAPSASSGSSSRTSPASSWGATTAGSCRTRSASARSCSSSRTSSVGSSLARATSRSASSRRSSAPPSSSPSCAARS
jgi:iron complex transport system permease protein